MQSHRSNIIGLFIHMVTWGRDLHYSKSIIYQRVCDNILSLSKHIGLHKHIQTVFVFKVLRLILHFLYVYYDYYCQLFNRIFLFVLLKYDLSLIFLMEYC